MRAYHTFVVGLATKTAAEGHFTRVGICKIRYDTC